MCDTIRVENKMITRQQLNRELDNIPPFASTLMKLTNVILSGEYTIDDVTRIIRLDQGLTIDVISYANSAESGPAKDITSVSEAIVRMGGARIMRYLLSKWFRGNVSRILGTGRESLNLWRHGVMAAMSADILCNENQNFRHPAAFTAALLHDIGRTPLVRWAMKNELLYEWNADDDRMVEFEAKTFGFSHCEIGAMILDKWHFPAIICDAVNHHADPDGGPEPLTDILRLANAICFSIDEPENLSAILSKPFLIRHDMKQEKLLGFAEKTKQLAMLTFSEFSESD